MQLVNHAAAGLVTRTLTIHNPALIGHARLRESVCHCYGTSPKSRICSWQKLAGVWKVMAVDPAASITTETTTSLLPFFKLRLISYSCGADRTRELVF